MKFGKKAAYLGLAVIAAGVCVSGCGGGSGANTITISIQSSVGTALILGQSTTLTATVVGATNTDANWVGCTYTTTTTNSSGTSTTSNPTACPSDGSLGTLSNETTTGTPTATYTAPATLPDPTKFPGLQIIITASAVANTNKTGDIKLAIESGVKVSISPATVAVPVSEKQPFFALLANDLKNQGVTWAVTQATPTAASTAAGPNPYSTLATCTVSGNASGCGSIDSNGVYTAPSAVPTVTVPANTTSNPTDSTTPATLTVVATSVEDPTQFALATVTVTTGGPITFNGITPTIAPQGATYWDIYLNAPGVSSASQITLTDANGGTTLLTSASGQVKVLFPIPTSSTPTPNSTGARVRLFAGNLQTAGPVTVSITDPAEPVTTNPSGTFAYNIIPVRPTAVNSFPTDVLQGGITTGPVKLTIDGGYFGASGELAQVAFEGNQLPGVTNGAGQPVSNSGQLQVQVDSSKINTGLPGLYSLTSGRAGLPLPNPNNPSVTNLSVFPSYATDPPIVVASVPAGTNPSAIDIDPVLGVAAVAETGSNAVQFFSIGAGTLTPIGAPVPVGTTASPVPTGLSVNRTNHTVAVVNYHEQSVTVLPIPGAPVQAPGTPFTVDISGALQGAVSPAPLPYAIGVDPDTNMALVAYSSTSMSSASNLGFIVNLNTGANPYGCPLSTSSPAPTSECLFAQVTLNTGAFPQIAMAPHGHLAFVTPGGPGVVQGVDVTKASTSAAIQSLTLAAGIVTVTTTTANGLVPGNSGTVLITGVPTTNSANNTNFNGVFSVFVVSDTQFSYTLQSNNSGTATIPSGTNAEVFYGTPNLIFGGVPTAQGIAINPVTNTAVMSNSEATGANGAQINLLNNLDQSVTSVFFHASCTFFTTNCLNAPELLGTTGVAWQPYSDLVVSYNATLNQVSLSDPVTQNRFAFVCEASATKPNAAPPCLINPTTSAQQLTYNSQITLSGAGTASLPVQNGTTNSLTLWGGLAVDAATNQAFVVMSGSGNIDIVDLGPCKQTGCANQSNTLKAAQISEVLVPSPNPGLGVIGGIPNASVPQGTLTSTTDLAGVQIFGSGFDATTTVRLDGLALPAGNIQFVSSRQLTVTIPASFLSFPHRYALDLVNGSGVQSNATDFLVVKAVDMTPVCSPTTPGTQHPSSVAIADQLVNGPFSPVAVVSVSGCNAISVVDINPTLTVNGQPQQNPNFGSILSTISVGAGPQGLAVSQPFGLAVVANNGDGTASVVNLLTDSLPVPAVKTGSSPTGVAINDETGAALVTNSGSSSVSEIDLALLTGSSPATTLTPITIGGFQQPTAVAIDPDRGTNNQGLAVVTALQLVSGAAPNGALQSVDIGATTPAISTTASTGTVTAPATGIVFDPTVTTGTANNGVFYASSSGGNVVTSFNPDSGGSTPVNVGINPTALAINTETGAILTTNFGGQTTSIVDTHSNPLRSVRTIGLPGSGQFGVAIDPFTNLAVVVDQANNRLLIFAVPN
ncbi:MAG TPA: hypothetical protein VE077_00590 [Candidatus Methylomirabilis sp.]|nr:hypothetical protein [Candidatus Methylomirabilis sp.]